MVYIWYIYMVYLWCIYIYIYLNEFGEFCFFGCKLVGKYIPVPLSGVGIGRCVKSFPKKWTNKFKDHRVRIPDQREPHDRNVGLGWSYSPIQGQWWLRTPCCHRKPSAQLHQAAASHSNDDIPRLRSKV